jgi:hypothetical protein
MASPRSQCPQLWFKTQPMTIDDNIFTTISQIAQVLGNDTNFLALPTAIHYNTRIHISVIQESLYQFLCNTFLFEEYIRIVL